MTNKILAFFFVAVQAGKLVFGYNLGGDEKAVIESLVPVNDGLRHKVILKRTGQKGSMEVDDEHEQTGSTNGLATTLNADGDIYLGKIFSIKKTVTERL